MSKNSFNSLDHVIGVDDAGRKWKLSPGTIKNYCSEGRLVAKKMGKTWIIDQNQPDPRRKIEPELLEITSEYNRILSSQLNQYEKDKAYAGIMTKMEQKYYIPIFKDNTYEKNNSSLMELYRRISISRDSL